MTTIGVILTAVRKGELTFLQDNLTPSNLNQSNSYQINPLRFASIYAQSEVIDHLMTYSALDRNQTNDKLWTALHHAGYLCHSTETRHVRIYQQLLDNGLDPHIKNDAGLYAYQMNQQNIEVTSYLWALTKPFWKQPINTETNIIKENNLQKQDIKEMNVNDISRKQDINEVFVSLSFSKPKTAFLFCGQGTQKVGMLKQYTSDQYTNFLNNIAKEELGYDLLDVCINGPVERLNRTDVSQPALLLSAVVAHHHTVDSTVIPSACAGFSLGEYSALVISGALEFRDALKLLRVRGEAMMRCSDDIPSGMLSVVGLDDNQIDRVCKETGVGVANYLFPKGRVLSGRKEQIKSAELVAKRMGAMKTTPLVVSGGFHSECMSTGAVMLRDALDSITMKMPICEVISNVTAKPYENVREIKELLAKQMTQPVRWEQSIRYLIDESTERYYELGEGRQLKSMMRRIDQKAWKRCC